MTKRVCVIGGGVSGISAVKSLVEEGLQPTCFESREDVGGIWNCKKSGKTKRSRAYDSLITNISKEATCFSDFPFPLEYPPYASAALLHSYLKSYIRHFKLEEYFHVGKEVVSVEEQDVESDGRNRWRVTVKDAQTCELTTRKYDCVAICSGVFVKPILPHFSGLNSKEFKGRIMLSNDYESPDAFEGMNVLVVGLGNSGADIAAEISRKSNRTILSSRSGAYLLTRIYKKGLPPDMIITSRISAFLRDHLPTGFANWVARKVFGVFDHETLGIESKYPPLNPVASYLINDDLAYRIFCGKVIIKPNIIKAAAEEVYFEDGSKERFDAVIFATGYSPEFPFISDSILPDEVSDMKLFEWMIPFNIKDPSSLAIVGVMPFTGGAAIPRVECQTRYVSQVMSGVIALPSVKEMRRAFEKDRDNYTQFAHLGRPFVFRVTCFLYTIFKDLLNIQYNLSASVAYKYLFSFQKQIGFKYPDRIASMAGFYPSFWSLFFQDPKLAMAVYFGPYLPYHYRIFGRHSKREFARERTLNAIKNSLSAISRSEK